MPNNGTQFVAPAVDDTNVLYGVGYVFTNTFGAPLPADIDLGDYTKWQATTPAWSYVGATEAGVTTNFNPSMTDLMVEEQITPVASVPSSATYEVTLSMSEETLTNINLAHGGGGTITTTAAGTGQPGKQVLTFSSTFPYLACAVLGRNKLGYPNVFYIPKIQSIGQVQTAYRRAAQQRLYPVTMHALCPVEQIQLINITAAGM